MAYDNLIECTRCGSDACYVSEVTKDIKIELCYGCGFQSNSLMTVDSQFLKEQLETLPDLYKALIGEEESSKVWMPSFHNVEGKGMVFADGNGPENWKWGAVKHVKVPKKERKKYKNAKYRADMSTIKHFEERDFMDALSYIKVIP
jgi:hypothetical protein